MAHQIIVMPGSGQFDLAEFDLSRFDLSRFDLSKLRSVAAEFGFEVNTVADLRDIPPNAAAVLFHRDAFGPRCSWFDAIRLLRYKVPGLRLIPCHGFSESVDWDALAEDGAYHYLWLPLRDSELRQCLGFVWDSAQHRAEQRPAARPATRPATLIEFSRFVPGRSQSSTAGSTRTAARPGSEISAA